MEYSMEVFTAAGFILLALVLFFAATRGWIHNDTIQLGANVAAIVALLAAVAVFLLPSSQTGPNNPQQSEPPKLKQPAPLPGEIDYRKLASHALNRQFVGQTVTFRALFLSEWSEVTGYSLAGISTKNVIFLNHRAIDYAATRSPLGSSDSEFPPFPLSVSTNQVDTIYSLRKGDFILVKGQVEQPQPQNALLSDTLDFAKIYIHAMEVRKLSGE
jgi:hypothetical protein